MKPASFEKREWIDPWRDRYPMTDDTVLVTFFYDGKLRVDMARYSKKNQYGIVGTATEGWCCPGAVLGAVLAWMPLPDPYDPVA